MPLEGNSASARWTALSEVQLFAAAVPMSLVVRKSLLHWRDQPARLLALHVSFAAPVPFASPKMLL
jgi:hypothetical protein